MIPRSPSPTLMVSHRERKLSVSSRSSRSSEIRHRRKTEGSPSEYRQVVVSPSYTDDYDSLDRKKRKKKEKKHKKEKKNKKKKKRSKHHSRSTSVDSLDSDSEETPPKKEVEQEEILSDWEAPSVKNPAPIIIDKIDTSACSPVSNDSHIASPEPPEPEKSPSPIPVTPPLKHKDYLPPRESPHTPPLNPIRINNSIDDYERHKSYNCSPIVIDDYNQSAVKSPYRNPSPELTMHHSHSSSRRRLERSSSHRKHRREKEKLRDKRRLSRSRSPLSRRRSRSPSWGRRHHSPSPSHSKLRKYKSRSPRRERERTPSRYVLAVVRKTNVCDTHLSEHVIKIAVLALILSNHLNLRTKLPTLVFSLN